MVKQLNPPIPVFVVGKGEGVAHLVIDYGPEWHLHWVVAIKKDGTFWTVPNPLVRAQWNQTLGRVPDAANVPR